LGKCFERMCEESFLKRVVNVCNALPGEMGGEFRIAALKGQPVENMNRMGLEGYGLHKCICLKFRQAT